MKVSKEYQQQWSKLMFNFFNYLPTKYKQASQQDWAVRKLVWDFKNGKRSMTVAKLVAEKMVQLFGNEAKNLVFACIPQSSEQRNMVRYKIFSEEVCRPVGAVNAFAHIRSHCRTLYIH